MGDGAHSLLYNGISEWDWKQHLICCGLASLAEGIGFVLIYGLGILVFHDSRWTQRTTPSRLGLAMLLGLLGAAIMEWLALRWGWWSYAGTMPRLPGTELGISPLLQFAILPVIGLFIVLLWWWRRSGFE